MAMGSSVEAATPNQKPHAVCVPFPTQGHISAMLQLAKLLHAKGFHITFVHTEYNSRRLLRSRGPAALDGLPDFRFEAIPDGLPLQADSEVTQDIPLLSESVGQNCLAPFRDLLAKLLEQSNKGSDGGLARGDQSIQYPPPPPVTCIVSDGVMSFTLDAAKELGIPQLLFWTFSACGFNAYLNYKELVNRGLVPLKDPSFLNNGYLETTVDGILGMEGIRLRDFPSFIRTTDRNDVMLNIMLHEAKRASEGSAIVLNTFRELEQPFIDAMAPVLPPVYALGPMPLLCPELIPAGSPVAAIGCSLWEEEHECLEWLDSKAPGSVVYVNFGSITTMNNRRLVEFAWGLANCGHDFLWIIRPDLVRGDSAVLPEEFLDKAKERGLLAGWCPQGKVLDHPAVGGFLTHCGWNSTMESICSGVPMLCWPFFSDQQTNCRYLCRDWGVGMEINSDVESVEVERLIRELMDGSTGREMKRRANEWKTRAREATQRQGDSFMDLDKLVSSVLLMHRARISR